MGYDLYLSYSGRKCYLICPKKYQYQYIIKEPAKRDPKNLLFGSIIGKIFEWFYTKRAWNTPDPLATTIGFIEPAIEYIFTKENWSPLTDSDFTDQLRRDLIEFIPSGIETIRFYHLLTDTSRAEVDLTVEYASHDLLLRMGGRADFIHGSKNDIWILDGKGSAHRERYVDPEQVIWYAIQHLIKYHVAPTRLGFIYYRFPKEPLQWVSYDKQAIQSSINRTFEISKKILNKEFTAIPTHECNRCEYKDKCSDGHNYLSEHRVASGERISDSIFNLETV
jgi:CRISPR/Cas system-associated exonuclease Cas4 (RecB family)